MPHFLRKYVFSFLVLALAAGLALRHWGVAAFVFALLFVWIWLETRERRRFAFVAGRRCPEKIVPLEGAAQALAVSQSAPWALVVEAGPRVSLLDLEDGVLRWSRGFPGGAMALAARPDGLLLWAGEDRLHLAGPDGADRASLAFEAPLYRQSYRILLSADGGRAVLHTPWFVQSFDPDLRSLGPRLRYEEAGHYMKYAVLSPDGSRLYTAGALLLDEEEGGAAMEARWDAWDLREGRWENAWKMAYESYNNSHLRGLNLSAGGGLLCAELYQEGYEFRLHRPDGSLFWKRAGEHPVLSPQGACLAWESPFDGLVLTRLSDQQKLYSRKFEETIRFKAVSEDGGCLVLSGRHLIMLGPDGTERWDAWFKNDPEHLGLGPDGRLAVCRASTAGVLQLPWRG